MAHRNSVAVRSGVSFNADVFFVTRVSCDACLAISQSAKFDFAVDLEVQIDTVDADLGLGWQRFAPF